MPEKSIINQAVVLGIGNRLMGDDGIGNYVVEELIGRNALGKENTSEKARFAAGETDIDYCMSELAAGDRCVIIDGAFSGKEPGSVEVISLQEVLSQRRPALFFHDFDLIQAMKRENMLKDGILITVEVCSVELSAELSPFMRERFEELVQEINLIIDQFLTGRGQYSLIYNDKKIHVFDKDTEMTIGI